MDFSQCVLFLEISFKKVGLTCVISYHIYFVSWHSILNSQELQIHYVLHNYYTLTRN
jgi:hypothetical protein